MKVLVTGGNGFIARNLLVHLKERKDIEVSLFVRGDDLGTLNRKVAEADCIFHLAGVNRPQDPAEFDSGNSELTQQLCDAVKASGRKIPVVYSSSVQAERDNPYGVSKLAAERALTTLGQQNESPVYIFRLPNVFGKWARPNYNSAVATFCHNIAHDLPIQIHDESAALNLVYVDDVVRKFLAIMDGEVVSSGLVDVEPVYSTTVGELAEQVRRFRASRSTLVTENVGVGLVRALYSTYLSYLPPAAFTYEVPKYGDPRGVFVEMLKTPEAGQFSFFTAHPGITRGGHYHHSKTEKFLVIKGKANFRFRQVVTGEFYELQTSGESPTIVETVPGWTHDITNIGDDEMIVMLWANEIFDREHPDTYALPVCP
ncbi:capsular biosynthesis protein [Pseudomonas plecoglossicida]|jgi:UDP-2-acetamido-2,6-beta-L-arabino-hexul-4-ose reductase|uniref:UDP-2-acetamido-2,6-beta-L-arabino-hexul-4-ose reductase n=1 Tax=Pseudomonas TaxID=286 RepID=UPI0002A16F6B|nr:MULTISPECIES: NAD-dependent epimerase/dehydratase family protein [Pseudomonas]AGA72308.1 NAD-dependent epimerase/dehydratase [Pseudomonas putida HB3267]MBO2924339.1 NAD-dependent epimerase/dehydratase family protein [Pseudomonas asiatica]MCE0755276.1 NAD-dependent epimerase/dehydratase family protein [Pseudomonas asiatica]MCE0852030.1 NAD-dependent epimerase/dehydratase family protein [Pseudomonas asiatica]MCE0946737.1 NAD-dependent epimerase/dehydratase family protein [Pseudomonas asiatica